MTKLQTLATSGIIVIIILNANITNILHAILNANLSLDFSSISFQYIL